MGRVGHIVVGNPQTTIYYTLPKYTILRVCSEGYAWYNLLHERNEIDHNHNAITKIKRP